MPKLRMEASILKTVETVDIMTGWGVKFHHSSLSTEEL